MKKLISILLAIVLLFSTAFVGAIDLKVSAAGAEFWGKWDKTPQMTGLFEIQPRTDIEGFSHDLMVVTDKTGAQINFNEQLGGWPLVKKQTYTIRLKDALENVEVSDIDYKFVKITYKLFPDTEANAWYSDAVAYAVGSGIMGGYQNGKFGTSDSIQRQDFLVMLARLDGVDLEDYEYKSKFGDVERNSYYESAVNWGSINGIVNGYAHNSNFGVGDPITREQIVAFLYRYAKHRGYSLYISPNRESETSKQYIDYKKVSEPEFKTAFLWAIENGVINGKTTTTLAPQGYAERCQVAQIMYNIYLNDALPHVRPCVHFFADATCSLPRTCTLCGATTGSAKGHSYSAATCQQPATCSVCTKTTGKPLDHNYVAGECTTCEDYSEDYCPKLYFTGDMSKITDPAQTSKNIECSIDFEYRSRSQIVDGAAKIKIQGSSSTRYAKKNYTINFYKDANYSSKKKIDVGWGAQSKYCLKANWIDKTHSRNIVTAELGAQMQAKYDLFTVAPHNGTIDGFPVEIYINGEFHGLYTMNIPKDEWMFGMDKDNPDHIVICGENWNDPVKFKAIPQDLKDWTVEAGPEDDATLAKVQRLVEFVNDSSDDEFMANFDQYLDLDSTINYYVMMNCAWLSDNSGKNMLLATYDGKVWYPTLYDLDTSWGTHWNGGSLYNYTTGGFVNGGDSVLWQRVRTLYKKEIAERYFELRKDILSKENILDEFNSFKASIPQEVLDRETAKWNTEEHPIPGYDISQIEGYLNTVLPRLDDEFNKWK